MKQICPKCHFIGRGKRKGSVLGGGVLIGTGFIFYGYPATQSQTQEMLTFLLVVLVIFGIYSLINYYRNGKICPICNHKKMLYLDHPKATAIMEQNNLTQEDTIMDICTSCGYQGIPNRKHRRIGIILVLSYGFIQLLYGLSVNNKFTLLGSLIIIATGIFCLISNSQNNNKCPSCKNKTYIPIDSPEAQSLVED